MKTTKSKDFWINHIKKHEESGLTQADYCKLHKIHKSSFSAQKSILKKNDLLDQEDPFIEVDRTRKSQFTITLSSGHSLSFDHLPDVHWISQFLGQIDAHQS